MSVEVLDPGNRNDVGEVSALHEQELANSPVATMGPRFLRRFYYSRLVQDDLLRCVVCRTDGKIVGFISYTLDPSGFMQQGLRRNFFSLSGLMFTIFLTRPMSVIRHVILVLKMMSARKSEADQGKVQGLGEVLSLVGLKDYQKHVPEGGKSRLTVRLFEHMAEDFRREGFERVHLQVQPENRASNIFCSVMGCAFEKIDHAGIVTHRYTYYLNGKPS